MSKPNPELVKAFKHALVLLRHHSYICHALQTAQHRGDISYVVRYTAQRLIMERLDGSFCLDAWLIKNHDIYPTRNQRKLLATRQAWLRSLIAEFS